VPRPPIGRYEDRIETEARAVADGQKSPCTEDNREPVLLPMKTR
jgi:hypothetical protein